MDSKRAELLILPSFIYSKEQVKSLIQEVLSIENFLYQGRVRESGSKMSLPKTTSQLDDFAGANNKNVLHHGQRIELAEFLRNIYKNAPEVSIQLEHADKKVLEGVIEWFRDNIHAQTLFKVSHNSRVGAGCMLRIKHKTYDLTLAKKLAESDYLLQEKHSKKTETPALADRARMY